MSQSWDFGISEELRMVERRIFDAISSEEPLLTDISAYVIGAGGKRIRPTVTLLSFRAVGGKEVASAVDIAASLELIHSATLIHDDINDGGVMRRGKLAAYKKFGIQNALVTGDFLFTKAFGIGGKFDDDIVDLTAAVCTSLAEGEIRQKRHACDVAITRDQYIDIIRHKTAMPISAGARIGALLGGGTFEQVNSLGEYGLNLGIAFQIVDDMLDVVGDPLRLGKPAGTDIREGNMTLLLIHALNDGESSRTEELIEIVGKRRKDEHEIHKALDIVKKSGAVEKARLDARGYVQRAKESLYELSETPYRQELIRLADFVLNRDA